MVRPTWTFPLVCTCYRTGVQFSYFMWCQRGFIVALLLGRIAVHSIKCGYCCSDVCLSVCLSVCLFVCWPRPQALQKRMNRSRWRLRCGLLLGPKDYVSDVGPDPLSPTRMGTLWGRHSWAQPSLSLAICIVCNQRYLQDGSTYLPAVDKLNLIRKEYTRLTALCPLPGWAGTRR